AGDRNSGPNGIPSRSWCSRYPPPGRAAGSTRLDGTRRLSRRARACTDPPQFLVFKRLPAQVRRGMPTGGLPVPAGTLLRELELHVQAGIPAAEVLAA